MSEQLENRRTQIAVSGIQELLFAFDEQTLQDNTDTAIRLTVDLDYDYDFEKTEVSLSIGIRYWVDTPEKPILHAKVRNRFIVSNLTDFFDSKTKAVSIPLNIMATLFGIAFSQTRAIIARNVSGTSFPDIYLPIINPTEFLKKLQSEATV